MGLWLIPRILSRSVRKIPATVPKEWVDEYRSGNH
jgi:hypothetical protein